MSEHRADRPPQSYSPAGPLQRAAQAPRTLVAVDIQAGFTAPSTEHVPPAVRSLCASVRIEHRIFTRFVNPGPGGPFAELLGWHKLQSPHETALAPEVEALATAVVEKHGYSPFFDTALAAELERVGAHTVLVCGIDTDVCVLSTAAGLFDSGFHPVVIADLCASTGGTVAHNAALSILPRFIGAHNIINSTDLATAG